MADRKIIRGFYYPDTLQNFFNCEYYFWGLFFLSFRAIILYYIVKIHFSFVRRHWKVFFFFLHSGIIFIQGHLPIPPLFSCRSSTWSKENTGWKVRVKINNSHILLKTEKHPSSILSGIPNIF